MSRDGRAFRLGLVGCGRLAEAGYLPAAASLAEVEIAAVADHDAERAARVAAAAGGVPLFADASELLSADALDALLVVTPAGHHVEAAGLAAEAGLPSLVEKPPAPDLGGAVELAALAPAPLLGFNRRFLQGVELRERIPAEGWLELDLELRYRRAAWGAHEARDDALLDAGVHLIDLAVFLGGSQLVAVRGAALSAERAELELELGRGRARIRCATDRRHLERVEVRDRAGRLLASSRLGGVRGRLDGLRGAPHPVVLSLRRQLAALAGTVAPASFHRAPAREKLHALLGTAADGIVAMTAVEAARRSAQLGGAEVTV